mmetsp:Transcript_29217/g.67262  ORF Transcript_29217/g.67262 Transcript_29217/m.67262 type:complete len:548 (-) Transcript_29217:6-1649(-)
MVVQQVETLRLHVRVSSPRTTRAEDEQRMELQRRLEEWQQARKVEREKQKAAVSQPLQRQTLPVRQISKENVAPSVPASPSLMPRSILGNKKEALAPSASPARATLPARATSPRQQENIHPNVTASPSLMCRNLLGSKKEAFAPAASPARSTIPARGTSPRATSPRQQVAASQPLQRQTLPVRQIAKENVTPNVTASPSLMSRSILGSKKEALVPPASPARSTLPARATSPRQQETTGSTTSPRKAASPTRPKAKSPTRGKAASPTRSIQVRVLPPPEPGCTPQPGRSPWTHTSCSPIKADGAASQQTVMDGIALWEEQARIPRAPPPSPWTPLADAATSQLAAAGSNLTDIMRKLALVSRISSPSSDDDSEKAVQHGGDGLGSPEPCRVLLDSLDSVDNLEATSFADLNKSLEEDCITPLDLEPTSQQPEPEPEELSVSSQRSKAEDAKTWREELDCFKKDIKTHETSWPPQTLMDIEDYLSRAYDFSTFLFINRRDVIEKHLPEPLPDRGELETLHEYPVDWPRWRIASFELRRTMRQARHKYYR